MVESALHEDVGTGDITTGTTVKQDSRCHATLHAKCDGVLSGMALFREAFDQMHAHIGNWEGASDGTAFHSGDVLASFTADTRATLTAERTALNFLQALSGVATQTARFVKAVEGLDVNIVDTRKTIPLYRELQKQAVRDGGGANHRLGLYDAILIKENHIRAAGGIAEALALARSGTHDLMKVEIEVTTLKECDLAAEHQADVILLDNMSLEDMAQAVQTHQIARVQFEASGNVTLDNVRAVAETGVDIISIGALTHSAPAADLSLTIEETRT